MQHIVCKHVSACKPTSHLLRGGGGKSLNFSIQKGFQVIADATNDFVTSPKVCPSDFSLSGYYNIVYKLLLFTEPTVSYPAKHGLSGKSDAT